MSGQPVHVLVVEDEEAHAALIRWAFTERAEAVRLTVVRTLREARACIARRAPDLAIVNLVLPDGQGTDLLPCRGAEASFPIVVLVGRDDERAAVEAVKAGALDYIVKSGPALADMPHVAERALREWGHIAERRRVEEALRRSEEWSRSVFEGSRDAIFICASDGSFVDANEAACALTGYSKDELKEMIISDLHDAEGLEAFAAFFERIVAGESVVRRVRIRRRDGSPLDTELTSRRILMGGAAYVHTVARDMTARKGLERQLRHAVKMEAIGRLAAFIAHDFNSVLTVVEVYSGSLLQEPGLSDRMRHDIGEIAKAGRRAASLTRQLLLFSSRQEREPERLELNAVVGDIERMLRRLIGEDVSLVIRHAPEPAWVNADLGQLELVIMNLALNARDAMPTGGVLTIEAANVDLDEPHAQAHPAANPGPHVMLAVSDTGAGMDEVTLSRIFEPFFTTKEAGRGTGLGLSTVYDVVAQSHGHITVESAPGSGSTFRVYLPAAQQAVEAAPRAEAADAPVRGSETILLVEDEDHMRQAVCRALRRFGYTVLDAEDAEEALRLCRGHRGPIHLLFTDVVMPGISGTSLAHRIGALRPATQILYMSGYPPGAGPRNEAPGPEAPFLQKPFLPETLALKVREVLGPAG